MAGIGFKLEKHVVSISMTEELTRQAILAAESTGSWWLTILFLTLISYLTGYYADKSYLFYSMLTYSIIISMILGFSLNSLLNKKLSDEIYQGNYHIVPGEICGAMLIIIPSSFIASFMIVLAWSDIPLNQIIIFSSLTSILAGLWITNNTLSILEEEKISFLSYFIGLALSIFFILAIRKTDITTLLVSLCIGFSFITFFQFAFIIKGYNRGKVSLQFSFLKKRNIWRILSMIFTITGIWIDKIIFWIMPETSHKIDNLFRFSNYDYPFYMAFTIYSISQYIILKNLKFLIREPYKNFFRAINNNFPFQRISEEKFYLVKGYRKNLYGLIYIYGFIILSILFTISTGICNLPWQNPFIFHYLLTGTFFYAIITLNSILLEYLQQYKILAITGFLFTFLNGTISYIAIRTDPEYYGLNFLIASITASIITLLILNIKLGKLEYETFKEVATDF
jgi:uncharacterized membrane protein